MAGILAIRRVRGLRVDIKAGPRPNCRAQRDAGIHYGRDPARFLRSAKAKDGATPWTEKAQREVPAYNRRKSGNGFRG